MNSYHPCWLCNIKGIRLAGKKTVYYPDFSLVTNHSGRQTKNVVWNPLRLPMRSKEETEATFRQIDESNAREAETIAKATGLIGRPEIVRRFDSIDSFKSFPVDIMHLLLENIAPFIVSIWLGDTDTGGEHCYLSSSNVLRAVDHILNASGSGIMDEFRRPRGLSVRGLWKADEWRTFIEITSLVSLSGFLPIEILNGWKVFVDLCDLAFRPELSEFDIERLSILCVKFFRHFSETYYCGKEDRIHLMRYTIHLILHIPDSTLFCGPLVCVSQFPEERQIGLMKASTHARNRYAESVAMKWTFSQSLNLCAAICNYRIPLMIKSRCEIIPAVDERSTCSDKGRYKGFILRGSPERLKIADASEQYETSLRNRLIRFYEFDMNITRQEARQLVDDTEYVLSWGRMSVQREDEWAISNYGRDLEGRTQRSKAYIAGGFLTTRRISGREEEIVGVSYGKILCFIEHSIHNPESGNQENRMLVMARWASRGLSVGAQEQLYARGRKEQIFTLETIEDVTSILRNIAVIEAPRSSSGHRNGLKRYNTFIVDRRLQIDNLLGRGGDREGVMKNRVQGIS